MTGSRSAATSRRPGGFVVRRRSDRRLGAWPRWSRLAPLVGRNPLGRAGGTMSDQEIRPRRAVLEPVHRLAGAAGSRPPGRPARSHSLWTWDHLYPIVGSSNGPILEGWLLTAAWAQATDKIRIGLMVGAHVPQPGFVAKMDHARPPAATAGRSSASAPPGSTRSTRRSGWSSGRGRPAFAGWARRYDACAACWMASRQRADRATHRRRPGTCRRQSRPTCRSASVAAASRSR